MYYVGVSFRKCSKTTKSTQDSELYTSLYRHTHTHTHTHLTGMVSDRSRNQHIAMHKKQMHIGQPKWKTGIYHIMYIVCDLLQLID